MVDTVNTAIYRMGLDAGQYTQQAQSVAAANQKIVSSTEGVAAAEERVQQVTRRTADSFSRLEARYDPLIRLEQQRQAAIAQTNRYLEEGIIDQARYAAQIDRVNTHIRNQVQAQLGQVVQFGRGAVAARGMGMAVQQAGFQVGDFAVQVASGQGVLRPFIQQGTQLISMFGPWGAVIGAAVAVVGALAVSLFDVGESAKDAQKKHEEYADAIDQANRILLTNTEYEKLRKAAIVETTKARLQELIVEREASLVSASSDLRSQRAFDLLARTRSRPQSAQTPGTSEGVSALQSQIQTELAERARLQEMLNRLNDPSTVLYPDDPKKPGSGKTDAERRAEELMRINDAALKAQEAAKNAAQAVVDRLDPVSAATRKLEEDQAQLLVAMANGIPIIGGYDAAFAKLEKTYQESIDPLHKLNRAQDELRTAVEAEGATIGMSAEQRAVYLAGLEAELHLRQQNVPATQDGAAAYVEEAQALEKLKIEQDRIKDQLEANDNAAKQLVGTLTDGFGEASKSIATTGFNLEALGQIGERVLNSLIDQFIQLAYVNPLENGLGLNKTPAPTLASVGGSLLGMFGGLLGGGTTAAAGAASSASLAASGPMFAFAEGGDFTVGGSGGTDSQRVQFMATPGEQVSVRTPGQVSNDNRRRTSITINLPPSPNSFGYSPYQIAQRTAERAARAIR
jgi:hypothetical protein